MQFLRTDICICFITLAFANSVYFVNQDATTRTIVFTSNPGQTSVEPIHVEGNSATYQKFPVGWAGNWYSVRQGATDMPGILGEVRFNGFAGATYFDVSAILNPNDNEGVKVIFPAHINEPISGCQNFPCPNAYMDADDLLTASTFSKDLVCLVGNLPERKKTREAARRFIHTIVLR